MKKTIDLDFDLGEIVFLRVRDEPEPGMVTGFCCALNNCLTYYVSWPSGQELRHFAQELTREFIPSYVEDMP